MNEHPDFKPGFNLILCYYAIRDAERMRKSFLKLLNVNSNVDDEKYNVIRYIRTIASTSLVNGFSENKIWQTKNSVPFIAVLYSFMVKNVSETSTPTQSHWNYFVVCFISLDRIYFCIL